MEEAIVIGALLTFCVVLGVTLIGETDLEDVSDLSVPGLGTSPHNPDLSEQELNVARKAAHAAEDLGIEQPRVLSRREQLEPVVYAADIDDDVFNRYRCYAKDLARLREELAYRPHLTYSSGQECKVVNSAILPSERRVHQPIGAAFTARNQAVFKPRMRVAQLPLADAVSTRV